MITVVVKATQTVRRTMSKFNDVTVPEFTKPYRELSVILIVYYNPLRITLDVTHYATLHIIYHIHVLKVNAKIHSENFTVFFRH